MLNDSKTQYRQLILIFTAALTLTACVPPPIEDLDQKDSSAVVKPKPAAPAKSIKTPAKPTPDDKRVQRIPGLPSGWTMHDPKKVIKLVETASDTGHVLITTPLNAGLEVVSVIDVQKRDWYRGKLDGAHVIALPTDSDKVLVTFSNRKNARSSVLLKRKP